MFAVADRAVAPDGAVRVFDGGNDRIQIVSADGRHLESWDGTSGGQPFIFDRSGGAFDGDIEFTADGG